MNVVNMKSKLVVSILLLFAIFTMSPYVVPYRMFVFGQPNITISTNSVSVQGNGFYTGVVIVTGTGFTPGGSVSVSCGFSNSISTTLAAKDGTMAFVCQLQNIAPGSYTFYAQDYSGAVSNTQILNVSAVTTQIMTSTTIVTSPLTITTYSSTSTITYNQTQVTIATVTSYSSFTITLPNVTTVYSYSTQTLTHVTVTGTTETSTSMFTITEPTVTTETSTSTSTIIQPVVTTVTSTSTITETITNSSSVVTVPTPFKSKLAKVTFFTNPTGIIMVAGVGNFGSDQSTLLPTTLSYAVIALPAINLGPNTFSHWSMSGGLKVNCPVCQQTILRVNGDGILIAYFRTQ